MNDPLIGKTLHDAKNGRVITVAHAQERDCFLVFDGVDNAWSYTGEYLRTLPEWR